MECLGIERVMYYTPEVFHHSCKKKILALGGSIILSFHIEMWGVQ